MAKLPDIDLDLKLPKPPFWLIAGFIIFVIVTWIPLALIARARVTNSPNPRVHLFLDMDQQAKYKAQASSRLFADRRAMRGRIDGTVPRGELRADDHYYRGYRVATNEQGKASPEFLHGFPEQVTVDRAFVERGGRQYNTFCYPCHGKVGYGKGPVNQRALSAPVQSGSETSWVPARNLHTQPYQRASSGAFMSKDGYMFFVISEGRSNMPGYAAQIPVKDRWAIVAYIRALQLAENYP